MTADLQPHFVADCRRAGDVMTLTVYRDHTPEGERGAALLGFVVALEAGGASPARKWRTETESGVTVVYELRSAPPFRLIYAREVFQFHAVGFIVEGNEARTDINRKPFVHPDHPARMFGIEHAKRYGQVEQERGAGPGRTVHERFWLPGVELPPNMADSIDIVAVLEGLRGGTP